jgi:hypothetical protein
LRFLQSGNGIRAVSQSAEGAAASQQRLRSQDAGPLAPSLLCGAGCR